MLDTIHHTRPAVRSEMYLATPEIDHVRHLRLSEDQFNRICSFIYDRSGIYFQERKKYLLESRLSQRMRALGIVEFERYLDLVRDGRDSPEMGRLLNAVTINETYFFRNPGQFEVLVHEIIPEIVEQKKGSRDRSITIWSAGCSTGDETYTLAILIEEQLKRCYPQFQFSITGTDINTEVLEQARRGIYGTYAVRNVPQHLVTKYFTVDESKFSLGSNVRSSVRFRRHNLMDASGPAQTASFDIVLCANVLIYFDIAARRKAVQAIHRSLAKGGTLLVGFSESLNGISDAFTPVRYSRMVAYKKE